MPGPGPGRSWTQQQLNTQARGKIGKNSVKFDWCVCLYKSTSMPTSIKRQRVKEKFQESKKGQKKKGPMHPSV